MQQYSHHDKYKLAIKGEALPPIGIPSICLKMLITYFFKIYLGHNELIQRAIWQWWVQCLSSKEVPHIKYGIELYM